MKNAFIELGDTRIKLSSIKQYGLAVDKSQPWRTVEKTPEEIEKEEKYYDDIFVKEMQRYEEFQAAGQALRQVSKTLCGSGVVGHVAYGVGALSASLDKLNGKKSPRNKPEKKIVDPYKHIENKYLYITTFQKDNLRFYAATASFDIFAKFEEIDNYLGIIGDKLQATEEEFPADLI